MNIQKAWIYPKHKCNSNNDAIYLLINDKFYQFWIDVNRVCNCLIKDEDEIDEITNQCDEIDINEGLQIIYNMHGNKFPELPEVVI